MNISINQIQVITAIISFSIFLTIRMIRKRKIELGDIIIVILSGGFIPTAISFIIFSFYPNVFKDIEDKSLLFTVTGLVLLYVSIKTIVEKMIKQY